MNVMNIYYDVAYLVNVYLTISGFVCAFLSFTILSKPLLHFKPLLNFAHYLRNKDQTYGNSMS